MFAGKGGTGKTSLASASGALAASRGAKTLVISLDPAHSLSDAFDLSEELMGPSGEPVRVADNLWIQEINVNQALERYWDEVHRYLSLLFNTAGLDETVAAEIAILPGMDELSALLYINEYIKNQSYDALILDCAPTAESMRFVSIPTVLEWYMKKVFKMERGLLKLARPLAKRMTDVPLPGDDYFECIERLSKGLSGVGEILCNPKQTTVRLVSLAEKMVLRETQRALMYFCLHGLSVEAVLLNRIQDDKQAGTAPGGYGELQQGYMEMAGRFFSSLPILKAPRTGYEVLGFEKLLNLGKLIYGERDPLEFMYSHRPLVFNQSDGQKEVRLHLPFASKDDLEVHTSRDELIIQLGALRKHVALPAGFVGSAPSGARFEGDYLVVSFNTARGDEDAGSNRPQ